MPLSKKMTKPVRIRFLSMAGVKIRKPRGRMTKPLRELLSRIADKTGTVKRYAESLKHDRSTWEV